MSDRDHPDGPHHPGARRRRPHCGMHRLHDCSGPHFSSGRRAPGQHPIPGPGTHNGSARTWPRCCRPARPGSRPPRAWPPGLPPPPPPGPGGSRPPPTSPGCAHGRHPALPHPRPGRGHRQAIPGGRDRGHLAAAGTVTGERIRDLTPGSVIITVQARQVTTSAGGGRSEVPDDLAVTVVRAGGGQAVWDAEPAAAGNTGGGAADALAP